MVVPKLNRLIYLLLLFSCQQPVVKNYENDNCEVFVAGKKGFWIDIYAKDIQKNEVVFKLRNKEIKSRHEKSEAGNINYFIRENVQIKDTLAIEYKGKIYNIYGFMNQKETAIESKEHKAIGICRVSSAWLNGKLIQDSGNNVLKVVLE